MLLPVCLFVISVIDASGLWALGNPNVQLNITQLRKSHSAESGNISEMRRFNAVIAVF